MKKCKQCNSNEFKIYPNKLCQKCLSHNREVNLIKQGKNLSISSYELITEYIINKKSINKIAKEKSLKPFQVRKLFSDYLIPVKSPTEAKKKEINESIFDKINSVSAFLLGYIFTDGDLLLNLKTGKYFLRIYSKHYSQVEKIKSILKSSAKIQKREEKNYGNVIQSEIYFLHIGNQKIINDLLGLGLTLKKNEDLKFPKISEKLIHHFIRGCWAGSGNVTIYNNGVFSSIIIGSIDFMTEIERILNFNGLLKRNIYQNNHSKKSSFLIKYANEESEKLYNYLYKGTNLLIVSDKQHKIYKEYFKRKGSNQI